tara:strand:- start:4043 stop:4753 length:711 start_codon:yes stop_codon:yes gene_type:complete
MKNLIIFISIFIIGLVMYFTCYKTKIYSFDSKNPGPTILFISGTHGNEDSGPYSLSNLVNQMKLNLMKLKKGKIFIIPNFNHCGLIKYSRYYSNLGKKYDLNRMYGKNFIVNRPVEKLVKDSDIIIDMHDAIGFNKINKYSIGSTIYFYNFKKKEKKSFLHKINKEIKEDYKKFSIIPSNNIKKKNTLKSYVVKKYPKKKYILFETTGQNNIQHIDIRTHQCNILIEFILQNFKMI